MGEIERNEVIAVALLALGVLLFANPAYTQGRGGSAASVQAQEINPDVLPPQQVIQIVPTAELAPVIEYESLNEEQKSIFDTGREGIYVIESQEEANTAVLQQTILYENELYLGQTEQSSQVVNLQYTSIEIKTNLGTTRAMTDAQRTAFRNATEEGEATLGPRSRGLSAYDYIYENETATYYETSTENGNQTVLSVTEADVREIIDPAFTDTGNMSEERREAVVAGINGEEPVVTGDLLSEVQESQLVKHDGSYYQIRFGDASVPIGEALGPSNFAAMGLGILLILAGGYMVRRIYVEKT